MDIGPADVLPSLGPTWSVAFLEEMFEHITDALAPHRQFHVTHVPFESNRLTFADSFFRSPY